MVVCMRGRSPRGLSCGGQAANGGGEKRARHPRGAPRERFSKRRESAVAGSGLVVFLVRVPTLSRDDLFFRVVFESVIWPSLPIPSSNGIAEEF